MICLTVAPGVAAQSKAALPELSPSTRPLVYQSAVLSSFLRPSLAASSWISHASQTLRKSMNSGGLPPLR